MLVKCLPSVQAIVPHRSGSILRSILKVQLLKSHVVKQIIVNLSQFRVSCYKFDVKLKLTILPKALCKLEEKKSSCWPSNECGVSFFVGFTEKSMYSGILMI